MPSDTDDNPLTSGRVFATEIELNNVTETLYNRYTPTKCDITPINTKRTLEVLKENPSKDTVPTPASSTLAM